MISVDTKIVEFKEAHAKEYNLSKLLNELGNPQNDFEVINVVGTNGKGTVSNILSRHLIENYKIVGLFTSPAFLYHNERFSINNKFIEDDELMTILKEFDDKINQYKLTFFEIFTLVCIIFFKRNNVKIAVIEAGIGGIFDSTSVFENQKLVCVTSISYDHQEILGKKIKSIIDNKIKIAKNGCPIFVSCDNYKYKKYILKNYKNIIFCDFVETDIFYNRGNLGLIKSVLDYLKIDFNNNLLFLMPGRFTYLKKDPILLIDGCHNLDGIKKSIKSLRLLNNQNFVVLYASSKNKNFRFKKFFKKFFKKIYYCEFESYKSWKLSNHQKNNKFYVSNWQQFIDDNEKSNLYICGSLYFIPLVYNYIKNKEG